MQSKFHRLHKNKLGSSAVEIVICIIAFIVIVLLFFDIHLLLGGAAVNDSISSDAARAAAMGPPGILLAGKDRTVSENQPPYLRALSIVQSRKGRLLSSFEMANKISVRETIDPPIPSNFFGGPVLGSVTVSTTILIHPQFILDLLRISTIKLTACKTFPYSWVIKSGMDVTPGDIH